MDFAPYQESPEATRAMSPPPRTSTTSPRASISPIRRSFSPGVRSPAFMQSTSNAQAQAQAKNPWAAQNTYFPDVERWGWGGNRGGGGNTRGVANGGGYTPAGNAPAVGAYAGGRDNLHDFETSLPLRLDYEACLAYLLLPPAGGVLLLVLERKSDYVRFHAWQSALLFSAMFVVHLIFSWSTMISWLLLMGDIGLIVWLTRRAYLDADTLDRCEVPYFGRLASSILDDE